MLIHRIAQPSIISQQDAQALQECDFWHTYYIRANSDTGLATDLSNLHPLLDQNSSSSGLSWQVPFNGENRSNEYDNHTDEESADDCWPSLSGGNIHDLSAPGLLDEIWLRSPSSSDSVTNDGNFAQTPNTSIPSRVSTQQPKSARRLRMYMSSQEPSRFSFTLSHAQAVGRRFIRTITDLEKSIGDVDLAIPERFIYRAAGPCAATVPLSLVPSLLRQIKASEAKRVQIKFIQRKMQVLLANWVRTRVGSTATGKRKRTSQVISELVEMESGEQRLDQKAHIAEKEFWGASIRNGYRWGILQVEFGETILYLSTQDLHLHKEFVPFRY